MELMKKQLSLLNLKEMKFDLLLNVFMMIVIELLVIIKVSSATPKIRNEKWELENKKLTFITKW